MVTDTTVSVTIATTK